VPTIASILNIENRIVLMSEEVEKAIIGYLKEHGASNMSQIQRHLSETGRGVARMTLYKIVRDMEERGVVRTYMMGNQRMVELVYAGAPRKWIATTAVLVASLALFFMPMHADMVHFYSASGACKACYVFDPMASFLSFVLGLWLGTTIYEFDNIAKFFSKWFD